MNWDDLKLFLALVRSGSVRRAGQLAGVSHSTIARRLDQFEQSLGVKVLERGPGGPVLTPAGEEILETAERVELDMLGLERRVSGRDRQLAGAIRVTMVDVLATDLLMPDLQRFTQMYPDIDLEIQISYLSANLDRGEADVALRLTDKPPENLIGRQVGRIAHAAYASRAYLKSHQLDNPQSASWIGFDHGGRDPRWLRQSGLSQLPVRGVCESLLVQIAATRAGLGVGFLPCFVGGRYDDLACADDKSRYPTYNIWLLRHPDTRETARLSVFSEFMAAALAAHAPALAGN